MTNIFFSSSMLVVRESKSQLLYNVLKTVKLLLNPVTILIGVYTRLCGDGVYYASISSNRCKAILKSTEDEDNQGSK